MKYRIQCLIFYFQFLMDTMRDRGICLFEFCEISVLNATLSVYSYCVEAHVAVPLRLLKYF